MADYITEQRNRAKWKLRTARGITQEAYIRENRALMREMVRLQTEIQMDLQVLTSAAVAPHQTFHRKVKDE